MSDSYDRQQVSEKLWTTAEHRIIAEWVCCEPLAEGHDLCAKGHAALAMAKSLLVDADPEEAWNPEAPLLSAVLKMIDDRAHAEAEKLRRRADELAALSEGVVRHDQGLLPSDVMRMAADEIDPYHVVDGELVRKDDGKPVVL